MDQELFNALKILYFWQSQTKQMRKRKTDEAMARIYAAASKAKRR